MAARSKDSFLVTLWTEEHDPETGAARPWRGSVEHLATKRRLYFSAPSELVGFLGSHIRKAGARADDHDT